MTQVSIGAAFGRWTVVGPAHPDRKRNTRWSCRCRCGTIREVLQQSLLSGISQSCGCFHRERVTAASRTHGLSGSSDVYRVWRGIRARCLNPANPRWKDYGGRGITMCARWEASFADFAADMGPRPSMNHSIERTDNSKGYEPGNCVWATPSQQQRNRRANAVVEFAGERRCVSEWAEALGVPRSRLEARLRRGWSVERALTQAPQHRRAS